MKSDRSHLFFLQLKKIKKNYKIKLIKKKKKKKKKMDTIFMNSKNSNI